MSFNVGAELQLGSVYGQDPQPRMEGKLPIFFKLREETRIRIRGHEPPVSYQLGQRGFVSKGALQKYTSQDATGFVTIAARLRVVYSRIPSVTKVDFYQVNSLLPLPLLSDPFESSTAEVGQKFRGRTFDFDP